MIYKFEQKKTIKTVKFIIILTILLSILCAIVPHNKLFKFFGYSIYGLTKQLYLWQPLTCLFLIPNQEISMSFVFYLSVNLYLTWVFSNSIIELKGYKHFILLLITCSFISLFSASLIMYFFSKYYVFAGFNILLYGLAFAWLMLHGNARLFLFHAIPFEIKWGILILMGISLFFNVSHGMYPNFISNLTAIISSYFYSLLIWNRYSPFDFLSDIEKTILRFFKR